MEPRRLTGAAPLLCAPAHVRLGRALRRATTAVNGLSAALIETNVIAREFAKTLERMAEEMDRLREEVRIGPETHRR